MQCKKYIYLDKYYKSEKDPISEEQQEKYRGGHVVGALAQHYFSGGIEVNLISKNRAVLVQETKKLIEKNVPILYEATFEFNDVLVMVDVLIKSNDQWIIHEVKSSQRISDTNRMDAALQYYVLHHNGLPIKEFHLTYLKYPRAEVVDILPEDLPSDLFLFEDVTEACKNKFKETEQKIKELKTTLAMPTIPSIPTGTHCNAPYTCEFIGFCNRSSLEIKEGLFA